MKDEGYEFVVCLKQGSLLHTRTTVNSCHRRPLSPLSAHVSINNFWKKWTLRVRGLLPAKRPPELQEPPCKSTLLGPGTVDLAGSFCTFQGVPVTHHGDPSNASLPSSGQGPEKVLVALWGISFEPLVILVAYTCYKVLDIRSIQKH